MSQNVWPFLMFEGKAEEAMNLYVALIPGSEILEITRYGADGPGVAGSVNRALVSIGGQKVMCTDSWVKHDFTFTPAFSLFVACRSEEEIARLARDLAEGGRVFMPLGAYGFSRKFAWLSDRFGVSWQLNLD